MANQKFYPDVDVALETSDLEIGAVEIKNGSSDQRATVNASGELQVKDDDANTALSTIAGDTTSIDGKITACNTGAVVVSSQPNSKISIDGATANLISADKDVTAALTAEPIASALTMCTGFSIEAKATNTGDVYIGNFNVSPTLGNTLAAGDVYTKEFPVGVLFDLDNLYVDVEVSGEGVQFNYWTVIQA